MPYSSRSFTFTSSISILITITKRYGERGHPCEMPKCWVRVLDVEPHSRTKNLRDEYIAPIISTKDAGRPKRTNAFNNLVGEIESKAFAQSSARKSFCSLFAAQVSSRSRLTMKSASAVPAPDLNPNCVDHMRSSVPTTFHRDNKTIANTL